MHLQFSGGTVGLWYSEGSAPLTKVHSNIAASTSTNSEDFHVGVLRIVNDATPENFYFSGVYIENGPITTTIGNGSSSPPPSSTPGSSSTPVSTPPPSSTAPTSTAPAGPTQTQWGQCGGEFRRCFRGWADLTRLL